MARLAHQTAPGGATQTLLNIVPCGGPASHASATPLIVKQFEFDPSQYAMEAAVLSLVLRATAANGVSPLTTNVQLFNVTHADLVAQLQFIDTTTPGKQEIALAIGAGGGQVDNSAKIYEIRVFVDAPSGPSDTIELGSVELRVTNTITG